MEKIGSGINIPDPQHWLHLIIDFSRCKIFERNTKRVVDLLIGTYGGAEPEPLDGWDAPLAGLGAHQLGGRVAIVRHPLPHLQPVN